MRVEEVLKAKGNRIITVIESASIKDAAKIMAAQRVGALVVLTSLGRLKGILSEREIVSALARCGSCALELQVRELTLLGGPSVTLTDSILSAMKIMTERRTRHLPVVIDRSVVGVLSTGDVVKARLSEKINENFVLQEIAGDLAPDMTSSSGRFHSGYALPPNAHSPEAEVFGFMLRSRTRPHPNPEFSASKAGDGPAAPLE